MRADPNETSGKCERKNRKVAEGGAAVGTGRFRAKQSSDFHVCMSQEMSCIPEAALWWSWGPGNGARTTNMPVARGPQINI